MITIPQPLAVSGARFILVKPNDKVAIEPGWESENNYDATAPKLLDHLAHGGNYGVLSHNGICVIDIDDAEEFKKLDPNLPGTFMVRRGSEGRGHIYFTCPDCPPDRRSKFATPFGDIRLGGNFYVVGANCIHPSGDTYEVIRGDPLAEIPWSEVNRLLMSMPRVNAHQDGQFNLPDEIREGNPGRNQTLYRYGCSLRALGRDDGEISLLIRDANSKRCVPSPLPEDEVSTLIRSVLQHKKGIIVTPTRPFPTPQRQPAMVDWQVPEGCIVQAINSRGQTITQLNAAIYSEFLTDLLSIKYFNKTLYIYDHTKHHYRPQTNEIETHLRNVTVRHGVSEKLQSVLFEVKTHLTSMGCFAEYPFNVSDDKIPVENGIIQLDYKTGEITLLPHSPEYLFTYKLSVKYDPTVRNCLATKLLERMVDRKDIKTLLQIPAQALLQMQSAHAYKKAYILQGEPHAGKTSYLKLLYRVFGNDFTAAISLQQLCDNHFVGGALEGKLLNIYDDLEDVALETIDQFKTLTGDCRHGIERKYESMYTGKITAVHIFTCNYPPGYPDKVKRDAAFWARWEYLKFPFAYPVNPNFYKEWYTDDRISAFMNLVLATMLHIKSNGLITSSEISETMEMWSLNSDHLYDFIDSMFDPYVSRTPLGYSKVKLHTAYINWCNKIGLPEYKQHRTINKFTSALQSHGIIAGKVRVGDEVYNAYKTTSLCQKPGSMVDLKVGSEISDFG
jgi:phage/plasmid-associated DNA primase